MSITIAAWNEESLTLNVGNEATITAGALGQVLVQAYNGVVSLIQAVIPLGASQTFGPYSTDIQFKIMALQVDATYSDTASSSPPVPSDPLTFVTNETPVGTIDGTNTAFTFANVPQALQLFLNGLLLEPGAGNDYTFSLASLTMILVPQPGDKLRAYYQK